MNKNEVLKLLRKRGTQRTIDGMARYGIQAQRAFGVPMGTLLTLSKRLGTDHALSLALWQSGWYEARLLAALIGDPQRVTARQMDAWAASFESWGDCDTVCFKLFDQTPLAWTKIRPWAASRKLFVKRASFALLACLALHNKSAPDKNFLALLPLVARGARDERNFVKKSVSWALRAIARRNEKLRTPATALATRLASSDWPACQWVGKDVLRQLPIRKSQKRPARPAP